MAQLIKIKSGSTGAVPSPLLTGEPAYSINDNKLYIGNGSSVVRVDAGSYTAECSTAAATSAKTVSCAGFILFPGVEVTVKFTVDNTAAVNALTLNVGGTGAKPIRYRNTYLLSPSTLSKDRVYKFYYGGNNWELIGDLDIDTTVATELASHTDNSEIHITSTERTNWNAAYGWGNHASAGYVLNTATIPVNRGGTGKTTIAANSMLYASAANTYAEVTTSSFGRGLLNAASGTMIFGLNAELISGRTTSWLALVNPLSVATSPVTYNFNSFEGNAITYLNHDAAHDGSYVTYENAPWTSAVPGGGWSSIFFKHSAYGTQLAFLYGTSDIKYRIKTYSGGGVWIDWLTLYSSGNTNKTTVDWSAKNLTLAGSITGATTITASSTIQANRYIISSIGGEAHLQFSRAGANYIAAPTSGFFVFQPNGQSLGSPGSPLVINSGIIYPGSTNTIKCGDSTVRWSNVYSVLGDFSSNVTVGGTIQATTAKLTNLTDGYLPYHVSDASGLANSPIYTDGTKVGIGTTSPDSTLDVNGIAHLKNLRIVNSGGVTYLQSGATRTTDSWQPLQIGPYGTTSDSKLYIDSNGNVGIGTTNPSQKLDVNGSALIDTILINACKGANSVGYNQFIGGGGQSSIGEVGATHKGSYNSAMGYRSLYSNTTGYYNSAMGMQSLYSNTTGDRNSAMGMQSLYSNTTGCYNSAMGMQSLYYNITGAYNSAMGMQSLYYNITGAYNSAMGYRSLYSNTTGAYNSAMGYDSGRYINGGGANETGNSSVFIGFNTRANADGETNQIVIGASAIGNGSNSVTLGNDSITKTILKGNVGIGYTAPTHKLYVSGTGHYTSNLSVGGTLGVTGASTLSSARITSAIYFGSSGTDFQINSSGSAKLYDTWVYNLSVKDAKPFINFHFGNASQVTSRIIEQATGVLDVIGSVKIPDSKYFQIGDARLTYVIDGGVGFLKLAHSNGTTAMHLVTTGGQTMYSTGVPASGGGGGAIIQLNDVIYGEGSTAKIYAPTGPGYPGYILKAANPSGFPEWVNISNLLPDATTSVKGVVKLSGTGSTLGYATTVARSDHNHSGVYATASHGHATLSGLQIFYNDSNSDPQNMLIRTGTNEDDILLGNGDHKTIIYGSSVELQDFGAGFIKSDATGVLSVDTNTYLTGITKTMVDAVSCNADTVDSLHAASFLRSDAANSSDIAWGSTSGLGIRFWNDEKYKIFMAATNNTTYGGNIPGVTADYNMYFRIGDGTNRGFVFESSYSVKLASINPSGIISNVGMTFNSGIVKGAVIGNYGVCSTASSTAAKTVTIDGFRLATGVSVYIKFSNKITTGSSTTLNINGTGAKNISLPGEAYPGLLSSVYAGDVLNLVYDGTSYRVVWFAQYTS